MLNYYPPRDDFELTPGLLLAIEPMVAMGTDDVRAMLDGWTFQTADGSASAHFEHTVAITEETGPRSWRPGPTGRAGRPGGAPGQQVRTRGRPAVTATVCSKLADRPPSTVHTVQPSDLT